MVITIPPRDPVAQHALAILVTSCPIPQLIASAFEAILQEQSQGDMRLLNQLNHTEFDCKID